MGKIKEQNRRSGFKKRIPVVFIICEGEGTEIIYFKRFKARNNNLEIHPIVSPQKSAYHLVSNTRKLLEQENYSPEDGDQVWCVFDRNGNSNDELTRAEQLAKKRNYKIAFSNPAFEIWYLLHFFAKYSAMNDADAVIKILDCKNGLLNYKKTTDYYDLLKEKQLVAIERADKLISIHVKNGYKTISRDSNPGTTVHLLVCMLLEKMK